MEVDIAKKSLQEEEKAIDDYSDRIKKSGPDLKKRLEHARKEEKDHARDFREFVENNT